MMIFFFLGLLHQTIFRNPKAVKPYTVPAPEKCNLPAAAIHASSDSVVIVDVNAPAAHVAQHKWQPNTPDGQGNPFIFQHGKATAGSTGGAFIRMFKGPAGSGSDDWHFPQALAFPATGIRGSAVVAITCDKEVITGKHIHMHTDPLPSSFFLCECYLFGHTEPVNAHKLGITKAWPHHEAMLKFICGYKIWNLRCYSTPYSSAV